MRWRFSSDSTLRPGTPTLVRSLRLLEVSCHTATAGHVRVRVAGPGDTALWHTRAARLHAFVRLRPASVHVDWLMEAMARVRLAQPGPEAAGAR